jgi:DNA-binding CsgD family transcriptional regulator
MAAILDPAGLGRMSNGYSTARRVDQTAAMRWPFAGREEELRLVARALSDGAAGGVVVAGPAGVGKTRLEGEAAERAAAAGCAVEWVRATRAAASIPLGPFAALLPVTTAPLPEGVELLAHVRHALAARAAGRRLVLCVDDGHLLDDASAALVHQLVASREAFAVATVRSGQPVPDALRALWKDELCLRLDLGELSRGGVDALLVAALGGPVDGASVAALWKLTRGNALFLRELVRQGLDRGQLTENGGVWRWRGSMRAGTRLAELVDLRIEEVGARARGALERVAVGGPLEAALLDPEALAALEDRELVGVRTDGRRRFVDVVHPLHGEAVRARLAPLRLQAVQAELADALEARGARRAGDELRIAAWRLDAGVPGHAALLTRAAVQALPADRALAERLAGAAVQAGGGFPAELALGRALAARGSGVEAEEVLAGLAARAPGDEESAAVALARARNAFWALDRAEHADAVLLDAERRVRDGALRHELAAQRVRLVAAHGRPRAALEAARPLLAAPGLPERAQITAAMGAVEALFSTGRSREAVALAERWLPVATSLRAELPAAEPVLLGMRAIALRLAGQLIEATNASEAAYARLLERRSAPAIAVEAGSLGLIWLARGRVQTALRSCREAAALLRDGDAAGMLGFVLAGLAQAAAQAGEPVPARAAIDELARTPLGHKSFAVELELGRAWAAAAGGELSRARALAREAVALARSRGQDAYAVRALHELCRLGDAAAAAPALAELARRVDGPFASAAAAHAAALVARDGAAVQDVAERFAQLGALLVAAEAADAAAGAHREAGRQASARAAAARAGHWLAGCEGARPPTLLGAPRAAELTPREREIALLAAAGRSSREIAAALVVSVRTVDNHLQSAYRKLGVTRRQDLPRALG